MEDEHPRRERKSRFKPKPPPKRRKLMSKTILHNPPETRMPELTIEAGSLKKVSPEKGSQNKGSSEKGFPEKKSLEKGSPETGSQNKGSSEKGSPETGSTESGSTESGSTDSGSTEMTNPSIAGCTRLDDSETIVVMFEEDFTGNYKYTYDGFGLSDTICTHEIQWSDPSAKIENYFKSLKLPSKDSSLTIALPYDIPKEVFRKLSRVAEPYFGLVDIVEKPTALAAGFRALNRSIFKDLAKIKFVLFVSSKTSRENVQLSIVRYEYHVIEILSCFRKSWLTIKDNLDKILKELLERSKVTKLIDLDFAFSRDIDPKEQISVSLRHLFGEAFNDVSKHHVYAPHTTALGAAILNCLVSMQRVPWSKWVDKVDVLELAKLEVEGNSICIICWERNNAGGAKCYICRVCYMHFKCESGFGCPCCNHHQSRSDVAIKLFKRPKFEDLSCVAFMGDMCCVNQL